MGLAPRGDEGRSRSGEQLAARPAVLSVRPRDLSSRSWTSACRHGHFRQRGPANNSSGDRQCWEAVVLGTDDVASLEGCRLVSVGPLRVNRVAACRKDGFVFCCALWCLGIGSGLTLGFCGAPHASYYALLFVLTLIGSVFLFFELSC